MKAWNPATCVRNFPRIYEAADALEIAEAAERERQRDAFDWGRVTREQEERKRNGERPLAD